LKQIITFGFIFSIFLSGCATLLLPKNANIKINSKEDVVIVSPIDTLASWDDSRKLLAGRSRHDLPLTILTKDSSTVMGEFSLKPRLNALFYFNFFAFWPGMFLDFYTKKGYSYKSVVNLDPSGLPDTPSPFFRPDPTQKFYFTLNLLSFFHPKSPRFELGIEKPITNQISTTITLASMLPHFDPKPSGYKIELGGNYYFSHCVGNGFYAGINFAYLDQKHSIDGQLYSISNDLRSISKTDHQIQQSFHYFQSTLDFGCAILSFGKGFVDFSLGIGYRSEFLKTMYQNDNERSNFAYWTRNREAEGNIEKAVVTGSVKIGF
jgi:hypothetical protein